MNAVILYRIDEAKNMHRFYRLDVQRDLFGAWCVMREWGRIGSAGQTRSALFSTSEEAQTELNRQRRIRERRGYGVVGSVPPDSYLLYSEFSV